MAGAPTKGSCDVTLAFQIERGRYGDVSLDGLKFAGIAYWPGRLDEGDGHILPIVD